MALLGRAVETNEEYENSDLRERVVGFWKAILAPGATAFPTRTG